MIIDAHAHLVTPSSVFAIRTVLHASNGQHSKEWYRQRWMAPGELEKSAASCVAAMDQVGTDVQLISPRPFTLWHSHTVPKDVDIWVGLQNDLIHETVQMYPTRFRGVCGLPQVADHPIERVFPELERCINELGFVGVLVNPDPAEGGGSSPRLNDPYWFPLWEKLIELRCPAHIHSAGCCGRETYDEHFATEESLAVTSLIHSDVFERYPELKVMISHGGGSIPYQIGRWRSHWLLDLAARKPHIAEYIKAVEKAGWAEEPVPPPPEDFTTFDDALKQLYFDTDVHAKESLELLLKVVGSDNCLFGTERPGSGKAPDLKTGRSMEDFKYVIDRIDFLSNEDRAKIYEHNVRKIFPRLDL